MRLERWGAVLDFGIADSARVHLWRQALCRWRGSAGRLPHCSSTMQILRRGFIVCVIALSACQLPILRSRSHLIGLLNAFFVLFKLFFMYYLVMTISLTFCSFLLGAGRSFVSCAVALELFLIFLPTLVLLACVNCVCTCVHMT